MNPTKKFRLVEVECVSQAATTLKNEEVLGKAKKIVGIEAYKVGTVAVSPSGRAVANNTVFLKSFLTLKTNNGSSEPVLRIPFADLERAGNSGKLLEVNLAPLAISKCEIVVGSVAGIVTTESWLLGFHYED